jgi:hypothetical protein
MIDGTNMMDNGHTTRRRFLKHLCYGTLAMAFGAGTLGNQGGCTHLPKSPSVKSPQVSSHDLYILTEKELLHVRHTDGQVDVLHRAENQLDHREGIYSVEQTYRVVVDERTPAVVYTNIYTNSGSEIRAYDADLNLLGHFSFAEPIYDFGIRQNFVYALVSGLRLLVVDFNYPLRPKLDELMRIWDREGGPLEAKAGGGISKFHLLIRDHYAYVLHSSWKDAFKPVYDSFYSHLIDLEGSSVPISYTLKLFEILYDELYKRYPGAIVVDRWGLPFYLLDHDVVGDRWYVLVREPEESGESRQLLKVLTASPPLISIGEYPLPGHVGFGQIHVEEKLLVAAGVESQDTIIIGLLELRDQEFAWLNQLRIEGQGVSELVRHDSTLYLGSSQGVHIINIANPSQLLLGGFIPTTSPVLSLAVRTTDAEHPK